ncbi:helix-turn-helix domain-containing protein [Metasolibacillus meyeri]|uniref:helix-turn-helix domain-containing protein n=1 Tax=Metasolibacillus meyeri TaxID=1071052 RepID=UPI000D2F96F1|nr:helix-turn-helix domain-containing protein [Metasolibacillus meyeri]
MAESNIIQFEGILSKGYGIIPKMVTRDKELSIEAKAIYGYLAAFAGQDHQAFPGVSLICDELNISENRYLKHRKQLIDKGYIEVKRERTENGFSKNIYILKQIIDCSVSIQNVGIQNVGIGNVGIQNEGTISNSSIINNSKNNKDINTPPPTIINNHSNGIPQVDAGWGLVMEFYEKNIHPMPSQLVIEKLGFMYDIHPIGELAVEALKIAVLNNAKNKIYYAESILKRWNEMNFTTVEQIEKERGEKHAGDKPSEQRSSFEDTFGHKVDF